MSPHPFNSLPNGSNLKTLWLIPLLLSFIFNLNVLENGYGWDDEIILPNLDSDQNPAQVFLPRLKKGVGPLSPPPYYRPLVWVSYKLDYRVWGETPSGFHLSVLVGHCVNSILVFYLTGILLSGLQPFPGSRWVPVLAASFFAVHPVHAEAVAWIAGRNDVFCTTFVLIALIFYLRSARSGKEWWYAFSMLAFLLALLTKEAAMGLVLFFPFHDFLTSPHPRREIRRLTVRALIPLGVLLFYFWMRHIPSGPSASLPPTSSVHSLIPGLSDGARAIAFYLRLLIFPFPVFPFVQEFPDSPGYLLSGVLIALAMIGLTVFVNSRRWVVPGFGMAWTFFLLIPAIAVSVLDLATTEAAERYLYAPSVGFLIAFSWMGVKGAGKICSGLNGPSRRFLVSATTLGVVVLTGFMGWEGWERNRIWFSTETFWKQAALSSPGAGRPHRELGIYHQRKRNFREAESHVLRAIELDRETYGSGHTETGKDINSLALIYDAQKRYGEAAPLYQEALAIVEGAFGADHPSLAFILNNLAGLYRKEGNFNEAEPLFLRAISIREKYYGPNHLSLADSLHSLARLYEQEGRYESARPLFLKAWKIRSEALGSDHFLTVQTYAGLADVYLSLNFYPEARSIYLQLLPVTENLFGPDSLYSASLLSGLAESYRQEGRFSDALKIYEKALEIQEKNWGISSKKLVPLMESYLTVLRKAGQGGEGGEIEKRVDRIKRAGDQT